MIALNAFAMIAAFRCCPGFGQECQEITEERTCEALANEAANYYGAQTPYEHDFSQPDPLGPWIALVERSSLTAYVIGCEERYLDTAENESEGSWYECMVALTPQSKCYEDAANDEIIPTIVYWAIERTKWILPPTPGRQYRVLLNGIPRFGKGTPETVAFAAEEPACFNGSGR